jgi:hypothetical protein
MRYRWVPVRQIQPLDPAELREGDSEVRPGRHRDALGLRPGSFGRVLVTPGGRVLPGPVDRTLTWPL